MTPRTAGPQPLFRSRTTVIAAAAVVATVVGIQDGRAVFEVGSGRSSFHPIADTAAQPR